mmetsp:Transcript_10366/g.27497  ORF Transcript_10366/g.27497 Transcript_10366/m.27497 type:complete len:206 (+) Transcript_10366:484-1101(+)
MLAEVKSLSSYVPHQAGLERYTSQLSPNSSLLFELVLKQAPSSSIGFVSATLQTLESHTSLSLKLKARSDLVEARFLTRFAAMGRCTSDQSCAPAKSELSSRRSWYDRSQDNVVPGEKGDITAEGITLFTPTLCLSAAHAARADSICAFVLVLQSTVISSTSTTYMYGVVVSVRVPTTLVVVTAGVAEQTSADSRRCLWSWHAPS